MRLVFSRCALTQRHLTWELKQNTCEPCNASTRKVIRLLLDNKVYIAMPPVQFSTMDLLENGFKQVLE